MWKPDESLDDYIVRPAPEVPSQAPRPVSVRRTGEVEVLKPLIPVHIRSGRGRYTFNAPYQPLWFRRFLAVGSGALVMIALVLVSAIFVGISDPAAGPEVATNEIFDDDPQLQLEEPFSVGFSSFAPTSVKTRTIRSTARRKLARPLVHRSVLSKPRRQFRPPLEPEAPDFVPTTLVIYAENGVVNTRIEPWVQDSDKKSTTFE